ncbi:cobalamin-dependent protein [Desulfovibrio sp. ZJ200]|uniref:B12-binding domain-containing radical SAM protein n=1 Tax=Desulfovibrio sp. ZJ200 TaxID=2709792 RepID=UPI0013E9E0FE|nr:cobalamin-dependent protein [Desulfovibrio sp. ZJ200]
MSTVVFVNAYEFEYLGTRLLASWLQSNNISTHNILLDDNQDIKSKVPQEKFIGYQQYSAGNLLEHKSMYHPFVAEDWKALEQAVSMEDPKILGFSARSTFNFLANSIIKIFKKAAPKALLVAGGFGPTLEPNLYLDAGFDVVVRGDGEEALLKLVQSLEYEEREREREREREVTSIYTIENTSWNRAHGGHRNQLSNQQKDLSRYPAPLSGHEHFSWIQNGQLHRYEDPMLLSNTYRTFLGRGCPGKCTYCSGGHWKSLYRNDGKKAYVRRNRNIEDVIEECRKLPDSIKCIGFCDEYWSLSREKAEHFFTLYKKYVNKAFWAYLNYEQMIQNPDLMDLVIDSGLSWTGIGFQTGSSDLLQQIYERKARFSLLLAYSQRLFYNFIPFTAQFIGGNCYESWEDLEQTLDLIRELPVSMEYRNAVVIGNIRLSPHPGSPIIKKRPNVVVNPMPAEEWHFRAILMEYCRFFTKDEFSNHIASFLDREKSKKEKMDENIYLENTFEQLLKIKQLSYYQELKKITGPWVYYGAGDCYQKNKDFFSICKPEAILVDKDRMPYKKSIDGTPIIATEEFFQNENFENVNFMVFLGDPMPAKKKLLRQYRVGFEKIHSCSIVMS